MPVDTINHPKSISMNKETKDRIRNEREVEILKHLALGYTLGDIAQRLGRNKRTMDADVIIMHKKYDTTTLAQMIYRAVQLKIIPLEGIIFNNLANVATAVL